jgi:ribosomal protein L37AE/L43A
MSDTSSPNECTIVVHPAVNLALNKKPACIFCHKRKIKCNSQWPCDNCSKRGQECEYEDVSAEKRAKLRVSRMLATKLDQLKSELGVQRQACEYWQRLCEQKTQVDDNCIMLSITRRPAFSGSGAKLVQNVCNAVDKSTSAFYALMEGLMPHTSASKFCPQYSALIFNRLLDSLPEDADSILCMDKIVAADILMNSIMFAVGKRKIFCESKLDFCVLGTDSVPILIQYLIIGLCLMNELELARHFYRLAIAVLNGFRSYLVNAEPDLLQRVMLSYVYCLYYNMMSAEFSSILPLWLQAAELFFVNEKLLAEDRAVFDEYVQLP